MISIATRTDTCIWLYHVFEDNRHRESRVHKVTLTRVARMADIAETFFANYKLSKFSLGSGTQDESLSGSLHVSKSIKFQRSDQALELICAMPHISKPCPRWPMCLLQWLCIGVIDWNSANNSVWHFRRRTVSTSLLTGSCVNSTGWGGVTKKSF